MDKVIGSFVVMDKVVDSFVAVEKIVVPVVVDMAVALMEVGSFVVGKVVVDNEGNIIEQGNHEELMKKNGFYAKLYNSQFEL